MRWRFPAAVAVLTILVGAAGAGCSSGDPKGEASGGSSTTTAADTPRSRHVVVVGFDGLTSESAADGRSGILAQLGTDGATATLPAAAGPDCGAAWAAALGPAAPGGGVVASVKGITPAPAVGLVTQSAELNTALTPQGTTPTTVVAAVTVPGLDTKAKAVLESTELKKQAVPLLYKADGPTLTVVQSAVVRDAADAPTGLRSAGELLRYMDQAIDGRRTRSGEDWATVVLGACTAAGDPAVVIQGDGVGTPGALGTISPGTLSAFVTSYLSGRSTGSLPPGLLASPSTTTTTMKGGG